MTWIIWGVVILAVAFGLTCIIGRAWDAKYPIKTTRTVVSEGIFDHVEYLQGSGGWDSYDPRTIVYWNDGRTYVFYGNRSCKMEKGHRYKIIKVTPDLDCDDLYEFIEQKDTAGGGR